MIEVKNITKIFSQNKEKIEAVKDLSFNINNGEIIGLAGINGAGKTTTLRIISALLKPTHGEVTIDGVNIHKEREEGLKKLGFLTGDIRLYRDMTPNELMQFIGTLRGMKKDEIKRVSSMLFEKLNMREFKDVRIEKLSAGTRQKCGILSILVHEPEYIIMDEPFNQLDVPVSITLRNILKEEKEKNRGILISSHNMHLLKHLCDRIVFIHKGKKIEEINKEKIDKIYDMEQYFISLINIEKEMGI